MTKKILALLGLTLPLMAVAAAPPIIKSTLDPKEYRALTLDNGLKVLLVSDPIADKSAASLDVHIGNGSDPDGWQGLAHFLEHMLFLGNQKYPQAGEYKQFIDDHGGSNNAFTSFSHTNYYFDISSDYLHPALDRFARFFIDPTFNETFVNRERSVVHSEYQARFRDESRRIWSARRQLLNPAHPSSRFAVGSEYTLRDRDDDGGMTARQKLLEFFRYYYSADVMTLAVVGKESLAQLEQWVTDLFGGIPDRDATAELFTQAYINPKLLASRLNVVPQKDALAVSFMFPVTSTDSHYRSKPLDYIANLIGHEGEGSLLALLESLGWAHQLSAGAGFMDAVQGVFEVSIQLTEEGVGRIDEIGALLFHYLELIKMEGVESWRYDESRKLADIAFQFAEEPGAAATARRLAAGLHRYPPQDLLRGAYMMENYSPELITDLLADLRPDNVLVQVVAKGLATDEKTPFYEVDFGIAPISPATRARWNAHSNDSDHAQGHAQRLSLPTANRFIPERLDAQSLGAEFESATAIPERLDAMSGDVTHDGDGHDDNEHDNRHGVDAWYRGDSQFGTPRAAFYFSVQSEIADKRARHRVLGELLVRMVARRLDTAAYPARLAGLRYHLYRHSRGFSVRLSGFEDKQPAMLKLILAALHDTRFNAEELTLVKDELRREWKNIALDSPSNQTAHELYRLLLHPYWSETERLAALDEIGVDELINYTAELLKKVHITTLSHGDVTPARAAQLSAMVRESFAGAELVDEVAPTRVKILDDDQIYLRSMDVNHDDSALTVYFQGRGKSDAEQAKMLLLARLIESPFFFDLRTTHRVGYLVYAAHLAILEVPGLLFSVQSPTHTPTQINQLINQFLDQFGDNLERMEEQDFAQVKRGLVDRILTREQKLADRTNRYWRAIDRREYAFDTRPRIAGLIAELKQPDILAYFQQIIQTQPRKLVVQSHGRRESAADGQIHGARYIPVDEASEFRTIAPILFPAYR